MSGETLLSLLQASADAHPERAALVEKIGRQWTPLTYRELLARSGQLARGLAAMGISAGDRVAMIAENSPAWVLCDFGIISAGAVNVAMFPSLPPAQIEHILADSGAWLLIVGDERLLEKALVVRETMPDLQIIVMGHETVLPAGVVTLQSVLELGDQYPEAEIEARRSAIGPDTLASLVYTSGTSGEQKGVMLTHGNFASNIRQAQSVLRFRPEDVLLSVLPLNHVFERTAGCYLPLACGSQIVYAESLRRLRENLQEIRPTFMVLVPRFFEVLRDAVVDRMHKAPTGRRQLFFWALGVGEQVLCRRQRRRYLPPHLWLQHRLAERQVLAKVRQAMGLDRVRHLVSGAAALALGAHTFFEAIGIEVLEGYGLTEAAPVVSCNPPGRIKLGCVGPVLEGMDVKLGEQSEILVRGPNVMQGYYNSPAATAAALDAEGWLHTGDVGKLDAEGYLSITDRLKDLLVLTSGKNVAPQPIENALRASAYISQAVVLGDQRQYVTALIVPDAERLKHWAGTQGITLPEGPSGWAAEKAVQRLIKTEIERLTPLLADFEKVRDFRLLEQEFSVEGGELTPTLKVKRRAVMEKHCALIAQMYH